MNYQDVTQRPDDLRARMLLSPTGRQLAVDGSLSLAVYTDDPTTAIPSPAQGATVLWNDAGTLKLGAYTRETGWKFVALT